MTPRAAPRPRLPILLLLVLLPAIARGGELLASLADGGRGVVAEVIDGDSLVLADGRTVRLVGIQAPKLPKGRAIEAWPLAPEAKAALAELALGKPILLRYAGAREDRYGRTLAELERSDGLWLQGEMLRLGLARVYTFPDNRALAAALYERERAARQARRGIWAERYYAVRAPEEAHKYLGRFEIVEGRVVSAARTSGGVFLNFGPDWHSAFTVRLGAEALRLFRADGADALAFEGERVRVRGYLRRDRARALMDVTHPEAIERL